MTIWRGCAERSELSSVRSSSRMRLSRSRISSTWRPKSNSWKCNCSSQVRSRVRPSTWLYLSIILSTANSSVKRTRQCTGTYGHCKSTVPSSSSTTISSQCRVISSLRCVPWSRRLKLTHQMCAYIYNSRWRQRSLWSPRKSSSTTTDWSSGSHKWIVTNWKTLKWCCEIKSSWKWEPSSFGLELTLQLRLREQWNPSWFWSNIIRDNCVQHCILILSGALRCSKL